MSEFGVNLVGHFNAAVGLGEAARASLRALDAAGIPCVLNDCDLGAKHRTASALPLAARFTDEAPYKFDLVHINPNWIPEFPEIFLPERRKGHYRIGYWLWETLQFPPEWTFAFELFDEIWASSSFCVEAISRVSPVPVVRMPLAIDLPQRDEGKLVGPAAAIDAGKFVFLFIFDFCSSYERKNPIAVIRAFLEAFGPEQKDVLLFLKSANADQNAAGKKEMRSALAGAANIRWLNDLLPREEVQSLVRRSDCYVSPHRAEGYGLTIAEAMALGKPVIATGYSGNTDLMTNANSYAVDYQLTEIGTTANDLYHGKQQWAEPDIHEASALMRRVYEDRVEAAKKGSRAGETIQTLFSPAAVGELIRNRLEVIETFDHSRGSAGAISDRPITAELRVRQLETKVAAMESSRFWKLRTILSGRRR